MNRGKIAIIGVGHVGSSIAYSLIIAKLANLILLSGSHPDKLWAEKKELLQYATVSGIVVEIETCDIEACKEADIIVIAASKKYIHGMDRDDFLLSSSCIVSQICSKLDGYTGVTIIVTNPVDFITYFSCKAFGLDRKRVIGAGTIIDSYRLRTTLRCRNNLWCIGEHGGLSFVPLKMQKNLQYDKEVYHHTIIKNNKEANEISVIIDIGANKGWFTVLFGKLAEDGTVYAFEPVKSAFNELKRNIHLNDLKNTQLYNMALSNYIGFGNMEIPFNHSPLAYLIEDTENCSYKTHVTTLDSFIQEMHIPKIDLIKIDAEGSEYNIILGAQKLLSSEQAPVLILEAYDKCLSRYGTNTSTLIEFLKSKNYCVFDIETMEEYNETNRISEYDTDLLCIKEKAFI